ncbi:hypothetical protein JIN84_01830 [Luteolibacter yonseiensis]|uniref:Uncharacterized protein n=1 Tax=Luteolibacter yonseiensis TaxID=1144680 RepID=A0A934R086_9BACT|nr:hypothetical protein [Luteolibacter yonseiensis]MBK1814332.1 hypothetical protein [Luteolibacter yonseiensis]
MERGIHSAPETPAIKKGGGSGKGARGGGACGESLGGEQGNRQCGGLCVGGETGEHDGGQRAACGASAFRELAAKAFGRAVDAFLGRIRRDAECPGDFPNGQ